MGDTTRIAEGTQHANIQACTQTTSNTVNGEKKDWNL